MIGVLALQGAFQKHLECVQLLGSPGKLVRTIDELKTCDALILPGGESTAHHRLISDEFWSALKSFSETKPILGTCCGLILMAQRLKDCEMPSLNALDVTVSRNAYGPQIASFETEVEAKLDGESKFIKGCFIRAPQIIEVGPKATILASYQNQPVIVQQGLAIGCTFHPEVFHDLTLHRYFLSLLSALLQV